MLDRSWEIRLVVHASNAREAVEELGGRSLSWLDDAVQEVRMVSESRLDADAPAFDPSDHPLAVRL